MRKNREIRVASPKEVMIMLVVVSVIAIIISVADQFGPYMMRSMAGTLSDKECTVTSMYTETGFRTKKLYTVYEDADGNDYLIRTSVKDSIGRKATLSVDGDTVYRSSFELKKPTLNNWVLYLSAVSFPITAVWWAVKHMIY